MAYGRVYVVQGDDIVAVSVHDGEEDWRFRACKQRAGEVDEDGSQLSFRVHTLATRRHVYGMAGRLLHAVDPVTGELAWVTGMQNSDRTVVANEDIVIQASTDDFEAVDPATGELLWYGFADDIYSHYALDACRVYWTNNIHVGGLNLDTGERDWGTEGIGHGATTPIAVTEETIFHTPGEIRLGDHPWSESLIAYDKQTGEEKWVISEFFSGGETIVISGDENTPDTIYAGGKAIRNDGSTEI